MRATFGWLKLETPRSNVLGGHVTGPYRWHTAVGARLSFVDDGLTFGTNRDRGVCLHFNERVPAVLGSKRHSALTVTVADCDELVATIGEPRWPNGSAAGTGPTAGRAGTGPTAGRAGT